jgi:hypothetical protein
MTDALEYRRRAAAYRAAAHLGRPGHPSAYLLDLAEHWDTQAAVLEKQFAGDKPNLPAPLKSAAS